MANKNHALDKLISDAAMAEFLEKGYEKASMRCIAARAQVTVGAIYTRYSTKDILFCSLVSPLTERFAAAFSSIKADYYSSPSPVSPEAMARSMASENEAILHLLFDDYDRARLLLCRSRGSSMEKVFDSLVERKISETESFFRSLGKDMIQPGVIRLIINSQFHMYFQVISEGYSPEQARSLMNSAMIYSGGGWMALLSSGQNKELLQEAQNEI